MICARILLEFVLYTRKSEGKRFVAWPPKQHILDLNLTCRNVLFIMLLYHVISRNASSRCHICCSRLGGREHMTNLCRDMS